jgi:hypothetical protein
MLDTYVIPVAAILENKLLISVPWNVVNWWTFVSEWRHWPLNLRRRHWPLYPENDFIGRMMSLAHVPENDVTGTTYLRMTSLAGSGAARTPSPKRPVHSKSTNNICAYKKFFLLTGKLVEIFLIWCLKNLSRDPVQSHKWSKNLSKVSLYMRKSFLIYDFAPRSLPHFHNL